MEIRLIKDLRKIHRQLSEKLNYFLVYISSFIEDDDLPEELKACVTFTAICLDAIKEIELFIDKYINSHGMNEGITAHLKLVKAKLRLCNTTAESIARNYPNFYPSPMYLVKYKLKKGAVSVEELCKALNISEKTLNYYLEEYYSFSSLDCRKAAELLKIDKELLEMDSTAIES